MFRRLAGRERLLNVWCANPCCLPPTRPDEWRSGLCCPLATLDCQGAAQCAECLAGAVNPMWILADVLCRGSFQATGMPMYPSDWQLTDSGVLCCPIVGTACCPAACCLRPMWRTLAERMSYTYGVPFYTDCDLALNTLWPWLAVAQMSREARVRGDLSLEGHFFGALCCPDCFSDADAPAGAAYATLHGVRGVDGYAAVEGGARDRLGRLLIEEAHYGSTDITRLLRRLAAPQNVLRLNPQRAAGYWDWLAFQNGPTCLPGTCCCLCPCNGCRGLRACGGGPRRLRVRYRWGDDGEAVDLEAEATAGSMDLLTDARHARRRHAS
mmetsp:Transcript_41211/g.129112  ORF Transcript_41211/g.129112 Transcript_41211/m.129112 type:complete len:325 (-) Transcript_41211:745-1719(-)